MSDSEFMDWFEAQYGKRPGPSRDDNEIAEQLSSARDMVRGLEGLIDTRQRWYVAKSAALSAWTAARTKP